MSHDAMAMSRNAVSLTLNHSNIESFGAFVMISFSHASISFAPCWPPSRVVGAAGFVVGRK